MLNGRPRVNGRPGHRPHSEESPGLSPENSAPVCQPGAAAEQPLSVAWITDELLTYTKEVWSRHLGRPVPEDEAVEMLLNVKRLAEVVLKAQRTEGGGE